MSKTNSNTITDLEAFKAQILEHIKAGKPLNGKNGVLTPLIAEVINAALEGEMEAHVTAHGKSFKFTKHIHSNLHVSLHPHSATVLSPTRTSTIFLQGHPL